MDELLSPAVRQARELMTKMTNSINAGSASAKQKYTSNREGYCQRVRSFTFSKWFAKPADLSAMECARHGWTNTEVDTIRCDTCGATLNCSIDSSLEAESAKALAKEYHEKLSSKHKPTCVWHKNPLPMDIMQGPASTDIKSIYVERLKTLVKRHTNLPAPGLLNPGSAVSRLTQTYKGVLDVTLPDSALNTVCMLALCGWEATQSKTNYIQCTCCFTKARLTSSDSLVWKTESGSASTEKGYLISVESTPASPSVVKNSPKQLAAAAIGRQRRFGLSPLKAPFSPPATQDLLSPPSKRARLDNENQPYTFDPLGEHRGHCIYHNAPLSKLSARLLDSEASPVVNGDPDWRAELKKAIKSLEASVRR